MESAAGWGILAFIALFVLFFFGIIAVVVVMIVKVSKRQRANDAMPVMTVGARVVSKRPYKWGGTMDEMSEWTYYATFEYESGGQREFAVTQGMFNALTEGDIGWLNIQGTRCVGFTRK